MKRLIFSLAMLGAASAAAQAQKPLERAKASLPAEAARAFEQTVAGARARGLPTEPLVDKALEGAAKRAPANLILDAVRRRLALLERADAALRPFGPPAAADVTATADAIQRGLSDDLVKKARAGARKDEPVGLAMHTLADLLENGIPVDVALQALANWRTHGGSADELRQLPATVRSNRANTPAGAKATVDAARGRKGPPVPPGAGPPSDRGKGRNKN